MNQTDLIDGGYCIKFMPGGPSTLSFGRVTDRPGYNINRIDPSYAAPILPGRENCDDYDNRREAMLTIIEVGNRLQLALRRATGAYDFWMGEDAASQRPDKQPAASGAQSIMRAVDILYAVAEAGPILLPELAEQVGLNEKTCYRIAAALAERGLLATSGRTGYRLGHRFADLANDHLRQREAIKRR